MTTLTEFLLSRIPEDARWADEIHREGCDHLPPQPTFPCDCEWPARLLAECEAKRRIVELHDHGDQACWEMHRGVYGPGWPEGSYAVEGQAWAHPSLECVPERNDPCDTIRLLALPYADHPDYREEWRL